MRKVNALILLMLMLVPSFILMETPPVKADEGYAKVYIICLPDVGGWTMGHSYDPSKTKEGAIKALDFKESFSLPHAHPKLGKAPPFYGISYEIVTSWSQYKTIIESYKGIVVINTHGERTPVPSGYSRDEWADKIAEAMLKRRVTWVHTAGYPFYFSYHQDTGLQEWNVNGFQQLMSRINKGNVDCSPPDSEKIRLNTLAEDTLMRGWYKIEDAFWAERGRPLKGADFGNYTVLPIWGTRDGYMTGAIIGFFKPSERVMPEERYGFGAYVHIGTDKTYESDRETPSDDPHYSRGYVGAAAAIWTETLAFKHMETYRAYDHHGSYHTELSINVVPVITGYHTEPNKKEVYISFGIYGVMKTDSTDHFVKARFYLGGVRQQYGDYFRVIMLKNSSKDAYIDPDHSTINWVGAGKLGLKALLFILPLACPAAAGITIPLGGFMLFTDWLTLMYGENPPTGSGVDSYSSYVEFEYDPKEHIKSSDGYTFWEFESLIYTKVRIDESLMQQWTVFPLDWRLEVWTEDSPNNVPTTVSGGLSFAIYDDYEPEDYSATVFYDDFEGDATADDGYFLGGYEWAWIEWDDWFAMDLDEASGHDFWNVTAHPWAHRVWCSQMGYHNAKYNVPNSQCQRYDTNMDAVLARSVDLRPYRTATLSFDLWLWIDDENDYFQVFYQVGGSDWIPLSGQYNDYAERTYEILTLPTNATAIIFVFYGDSNHPTQGGDFNYGVWIDNVEIRAELPNDAINTSQDAGSTAHDALPITISDSTTNYAGYLNNDADCYNFTVSSSDIESLKRIKIDLTSPYGAEFVAELHDPNGVLKAGPSNIIDYKLYANDNPGNWTVKIYAIKGFGQYNFDIEFLPSGGGGCPFVYVWNGKEYVIDNNVLPASEVSNGSDVEDYYRLEQTLIPWYDGARFSWYSLQISEFENEHSYIDQVKLLAVDHPAHVNVAVTPDGTILTYGDPYEPVSCIDNYEVDQLDTIASMDDQYYEGVAGSYLNLDFGDLDISNGAKLVMRADFPEKWMSIHVQMLNSTLSWETVAVVDPRVFWATEIVDLLNHLPDANGELKVRLYFTAQHKIDYVGLDTTPQQDFQLHEAYLLSAIHSTQGNLRWRLLKNDNTYAELIPSEQIRLTFVLPNSQEQARTFIFYTNGYYKTIQNND